MECNASNEIVELELISDADKYLFFEKGVRGGASYISKRYRKFSNKYFKSYDSKHIVDICYAMCKFFARGEFKWIEPIEFDSNKYNSNS